MLFLFTLFFCIKTHQRLVDHREDLQRYEDYRRHRENASKAKEPPVEDTFAMIKNKIKIKVENIRYPQQEDNRSDLEMGSDNPNAQNVMEVTEILGKSNVGQKSSNN